MIWDGVTLAEFVKTVLYDFFSNAVSEASQMNNTQYAALLKKKYNHSGCSFWTEQYKAYLNARSEKIEIIFKDPVPVELDGDNTFTLTWNMAARQIRAWEYEKAHESVADNKEDNMARKLKLDTSISKDIMAAASDSFIDSLKMIEIDDIVPNNDNFYEISDIEELAEDIERQGLMSILVVSADDSGKYTLISGHRRLAAIKQLIADGKRKSTTVPCYIKGAKSREETELDLIMLNATQRKYSDTDAMREYEELERIFKALADAGKPIKGKMRDNIAKMMNVSPSQVAKIDNIKRNAVPEIEQAVKSGDMSISTANEVAKLSPEEQLEIAEKKPDITNKEVKEMQKKSPAKPKKEKASPSVPDEPEPTEDEEDTDGFEDEIEEDTDIEETLEESAESSTLRYTFYLSDNEAEQLYSFLSDNFDYDFKQEFPNLDDVIGKLASLLGK